MIGGLLLIITIIDSQKLDWKQKQIIYTGAFVEIYNWHNRRLVHKTYGIVKLKKYSISQVENSLNLESQQFYKICEVLKNTHIMPNDINRKTVYLNNYINWDQLNQLYNPEWQNKKTRFANIIVYRLIPASKKVIEQR